MKHLLTEWREFLKEEDPSEIEKLERAYVQGLKDKSNTQAGGSLQRLTKLAKMGKYNLDNLKKLKSSIKESSEDDAKLELGKKLIQLRLPSDKDYHKTDFDEFFRVVKSIEKLPQSEDELYDAYMFARRNEK